MNQPSPILPPNLQAALRYARSGWRVFPCRPRREEFDGRDGKRVILKEKEPLVGKDRDPVTGNPIDGTGGLAKATTDEEQIKAWWRKWPDALIGALTGPGMDAFVVDFDVIDKKTGEVFELSDRIAALEAAIGCPLPETAMAVTPSGGCHLYFALPDVPEGMRLGNSNKRLPFKIDIRGDATGYVIVPPSRRTDMGDGIEDGRYRWEKRYSQVGVAQAPQGLLDLLFVPVKGKKKAEPVGERRGRAAARPTVDHVAPRPADVSQAEYEAIRKYGLSALEEECRLIRSAPSGARNNQLNESAFNIATLVGSTPFPALDARFARGAIEAAAADNPGDDDDRALIATIDSGWAAGEAAPRDLTNVATRARQRAERPHRSSLRSASALTPPPATENGGPNSQRGGGTETGGRKGTGDAIDADLTLKSALLPMTDLGNLERFLLRHGRNFLCVAAWAESAMSPGYVAWDERRWNRSMADALFGLAAQETMRLIQDEADFIRASGVPFPPEEGDLPDLDGEAEEVVAEEEEQGSSLAEEAFLAAKAKRMRRRSSMWYLQRDLARQTRHDGPRHDHIVQVKSNGDIVLYSDKLAAWGRTSESAGHIECIRKLAPPRLSARPEDFDADPLMLNVQNGTLVFHRPEGDRPARVELREHRREDKITKLARASYDKDADCPQFRAFLEHVQPAEDMRDWLTRWSGYNALGIADAQVMALFYGEGSNGKGVWVQTHAHILGDYAWATGIETFMDSGFKRNGGGPSPHLAALAGRRMVYANEPEDNSKFSDGLVKSLTSDEPIGGVRELYGPAFELLITFTNTVMANNLPRIGTDFGIRRRMQVVPWMVIIPKEAQDPLLKAKLRAEMSGILNQMIRGALAYLTDGLTMPEAMVEATKAYHDDNDILGQFLTMCVAREPGETVGATALHGLFVAWQTWSGNLPQTGKAWSTKKLRQEMERKSFRINKSSTMKWQDIVLRYDPIDFIDEHGKPVERDLPAPRHSDKPSAGAPLGTPAQGGETPPVPPSALPPMSLDDDDLPP